MKVSASGLYRALVCPASMHLPHVGSITGATTAGNWRHEYLRAVNEVGAVQAFEQAPEEVRPMLAAIDLDGLPLDPADYSTELAFAYDTCELTARVLGQNMGRNYPELKPTEIPGTADVVALLGEDAVFVADWKGVDPTTPRAEVNPQMRFLALAAARAYGRSRAVVELIHLKEDGSAWRDRAEFDALALDLFGIELEELVKASPDRIVEGPHCKRCPAFQCCPAKRMLVASLAQGHENALAEQLTPELAAAALLRVEAIEGIVKHVRERLEQFAETTPIPLPDGEVLGPVKVERETIDPVIALPVLAARFGEEVAAAAVKNEPSMPKNRLTLALKMFQATNKGLKITHLEKEALGLLRERGAVKVKESTSIRRHKPEPVPELPAEAEQPAA